eukprot:m.221075 g.221075  ORF g.221075 m.221075 type:complete len:452 (+) comp33337_c0_seq1:235-1590(+)
MDWNGVWATSGLCKEAAALVGTPCYLYDAATLAAQARQILAFPNAYGLTVRYAMKACPNATVLNLFHSLGIHIDASSCHEVSRAIAAGIPASHISLSTQNLSSDFVSLVKQGVLLNACSLKQLREFGAAFRGGSVGIRFNPGVGSGGIGRTNVGGPDASFGVWHELVPEVKNIVEEFDLNIVRVHTHIGSGSDPSVWTRVSTLSLAMCELFPSVSILNLGGGFKVGRMPEDFAASTKLDVVGAIVKEHFLKFNENFGRKLKLEIEPGTFLLANSGVLISTAQDIVNTGMNGRLFIKCDSGMTEILRPQMYGAQHPMRVIPQNRDKTPKSSDTNDQQQPESEPVSPKVQPPRYVVVGHCCESGDILTPHIHEPEVVADRKLGACEIGDLIVVGGAGAYCSSMCAKNYNSYPEAPEVICSNNGELKIIRKRQALEQMWSNEISCNASDLLSSQ